MSQNIIFYTIHCPQCKVLQTLMTKKNITFDVIDDKDIVLSKAKEYNIRSAPFALIDGECYDAKKLQIWIKEQ